MNVTSTHMPVGSRRTGTSKQGERLLVQVAEMFAGLSGTIGPRKFAIFSEIFGLLVERVDDKALAQFSEMMAPLDYAPEGLITHLAFHQVDLVAAPVIRLSPVLGSKQISLLIDTMPRTRSMLVASRTALASEHCAQLLDLGDADICLALAENQTACLSVLDLVRLADRANRDPRLIDGLSRRSNLPSAVTAQLADTSLAVVRRLSRPDLVADRRDAESSPAMAVTTEAFDEAERELRDLITSGKMDERHVRQYAQRGEIAQLVLALSFIFKCRRGGVVQILNADSPDQFILRARQEEFSNATVQTILESGHWRRHLSRSQRQLAMQKYQSLSRRDAQLMMAPAA